MQTRIDNMTATLQESYYVYNESINFFMITKLLRAKLNWFYSSPLHQIEGSDG